MLRAKLSCCIRWWWSNSHAAMNLLSYNSQYTGPLKTDVYFYQQFLSIINILLISKVHLWKKESCRQTRSLGSVYLHLPLWLQRQCCDSGGRLELYHTRRLEPGRELHLSSLHWQCLVALPHKVIPIVDDVNCADLDLLFPLLAFKLQNDDLAGRSSDQEGVAQGA